MDTIVELFILLTTNGKYYRDSRDVLRSAFADGMLVSLYAKEGRENGLLERAQRRLSLLG